MALSRHKRDTDARRSTPVARIAAPVAAVVTLGAVGAGVLAATPPATDDVVIASQGAAASVDAAVANRGTDPFLSRSFSRADTRSKEERREARERREERQERRATRKAIRQADNKLWTTAPLNLWDAARKAQKVGLVDEGKKVLVTGRRANSRAEIVLDGKARWVTAAYLSHEKPEPEPQVAARSAAPAVGGACTNGSSVDGQPNVIAVHRAVCANFPEITSYGTYRGDGEHAQGIAIDIMVSGERGWQVANFLRANHAELGISYLIYAQRIWSVERAGEGWRGMSDRGSTTANHYDHVHVTTY